MKSFIAKRVISNLVNLVNLRYTCKLLNYKENNKKIYNSSDHNFKNIPLYNYNEQCIIYRNVLFCFISTVKNGA